MSSSFFQKLIQVHVLKQGNLDGQRTQNNIIGKQLT
jgi:hypothetical protein